MARTPAMAEIEVQPEADRLEGTPHPRATARLIGYETIERALARAFGPAGRPHHAWLITGREGIGKATLAYRLASYILARGTERVAPGQSLDVDPGAPAARQVRSLSHPGLLVIRRPYDTKLKRFSTQITIDEVRRIRDFLQHSGEGARVVIVDSANEMNLSAANALLKALEEPPARTTFLLVASRPGQLLATIRSRCRRLDLPGLDDASLTAAAAQALSAGGGPPPDFPAGLIGLAGGSVKRLVVLREKGGFERVERLKALLTGLPRVDWGSVHKLADEVSGAGSDERFDLTVALLLDLIAQIARSGATGGPAPLSEDACRRLAGEGRLASLTAVWETLLQEAGDTRALNLDRKTLLLDTFARLATTVR